MILSISGITGVQPAILPKPAGHCCPLVRNHLSDTGATLELEQTVIFDEEEDNALDYILLHDYFNLGF